MPGERRGSRIRIEGQRHLRSEGVSVDAVLERDRRQLDVREQQVLAAVAEDDHCEVSGGGPVLASSYRCLEPTCHQPSTPADSPSPVHFNSRYLARAICRACRYTILLPIGVLSEGL